MDENDMAEVVRFREAARQAPTALLDTGMDPRRIRNFDPSMADIFRSRMADLSSSTYPVRPDYLQREEENPLTLYLERLQRRSR